MAGEYAKPKGTLIVDVELRLPQESDSLYKILGHPFVPRREHILSQECTQDEAAQIVTKIRESNINNTFHATWTGANEL